MGTKIPGDKSISHRSIIPSYQMVYVKLIIF